MTDVGAVSIIGAGRIGLGLATLLADAGIAVTIGSRTPDDDRFAGKPWTVTSPAQAIGADIVVLAVPHAAIEETLRLTGGPRAGAVVVDTANAVDPTSRERVRSALDEPHGRWLQRRLPEATVVRAFSHVQDELLVSRAHRQPGMWAVAVAAADARAAGVGASLVTAARYVPVQIGGLDDSAVLDPGGILFPNMFLPADMRDLVRH